MHCKLRFENSTNQRYYLVYVTRDLFGEWVILRSWGGINKAGGQTLTAPCLSYEDALVKIEKIKKIREKRGYRLRKISD